MTAGRRLFSKAFSPRKQRLIYIFFTTRFTSLVEFNSEIKKSIFACPPPFNLTFHLVYILPSSNPHFLFLILSSCKPRANEILLLLLLLLLLHVLSCKYCKFPSKRCIMIGRFTILFPRIEASY